MRQQEIKIRQIICYTYIIGVIGLIGMGRALENMGMAFLAVAMEGAGLFFLPVTCGVSNVIAKLQRNRRNKGQFKGAARMRGQFFILQGTLGALLAVLLVLLAKPLAKSFFRAPYSESAMRLLAPAILFQALSAALLGYFQGSGSYMPSLVSAALRQVLFLVLGTLSGRWLADYGHKVSSLLKNDCYSGMYGAMGVALGIAVTELLVLLFLLAVYLGSDKKADEQKSQEGLRRTESMGDVIRIYCGAQWQGVCTALLAVLPVVVSGVLYLRGAALLGADASALVSAVDGAEAASGELTPLTVVTADLAVAGYGSLFGKCLLPCAVLTLLLAARCFSVYGRLCGIVRREDTRYARDVAAAGLHYVWTAGLYFAVTAAVMAPRIAAGFFPGGEESVGGMLRIGGGLVLAAGLVVLFSMILLAHGERYILMGMLGIWAVLYIILQNIFVRGSGYSAAGILYGVSVSTVILLAGLAAYCVWRGRINTDYIRILGVPLAGAGIMGLLILLVNKLLGAHLGDVAAVAVAALLGAVVYGVILAATKNIREYEISVLYGKQVRKLLERIIS